ncbi:DUF3466 family protein [Salipiger sp. 1_MG-2023]|uniref:DUF3466 family protein n=1 Tax=Salipiger sp. 1_MG-2023 TaxID=3062665 RepID=UPI0026E3FFF4|nr:DUF3466 family protein [Salipiger sp. 1_MG-2023]
MALFALTGTAQAATLSYSVTEIGDRVVGNALNGSGTVVGRDGAYGFIYKDSAMRLLPPDEDHYCCSIAFAVNNDDVAVGHTAWDYYDSGNSNATKWAGGVGEEMSNFRTSARDINDSGMSAGIAWSGFSNEEAFVWFADGSQRYLGHLYSADYRYSYAYALNESGQVVGQSDVEWQYGMSDLPHAFIWDLGTGMLDLNDRVDTGATVLTSGNDINDFGVITGSEVTGDVLSGFYLDGSDYRSVESGALGFSVVTPSALNNEGIVVGSAGDDEAGFSAFFWAMEGGMVDLNTLIDQALGISLIEAVDINDAGQILALGNTDGSFFSADANRTFLLTPLAPVPLPASMLMLLAGCMALCALRLRGVGT